MKKIVVADKGWVFVGDVAENPDGTITITNAKNIRVWGTTQGLGQLRNGPTNQTVTDEYGTVVCKPVFMIDVEDGW